MPPAPAAPNSTAPVNRDPDPKEEAKQAPPRTGPRSAAAQSPQEEDPFSPNSDPMAAARWLHGRGWRAQGSPHLSTTRWWDPTRSREDAYSKQVRHAPHITGWNDKTKSYDTAMKPVMVKDRHGQMTPCEQTVFTPAGTPYPLNQAMEIQLERDRLAAEKAARAD